MILTAALLLTGPSALPASAQMASTPAPAQAKEGHFARLDTNGDGYVDKSEVRGPLAEHFDAIDSDHDGRLSREELKAARAAHGMKGNKAGKEGKGGGLAMLDADHDGRVSWAEFSAGIKAHFDRLDANHDGYLDATEARMAHRHGGHHDHGAASTWGAPKDQTSPAPPAQ
jgi:Ca2+-binding EF-hand superfamily protein